MNSNSTELKQVVHTHRTSCRSSWPRGFGKLNTSPRSWIFTSVSVDFSLSSYFSLPPRSEYLFTLRQTEAQNLSDMWRSTLEIGAAQLRSVTEISPKSPFSCVNRSPIWYDSRAFLRAILCNENFIFFLFISCQIPSAAFPKVRRRCSCRVR